MAALALSVPLARITSVKTTIAIKGHQRSTASKHRRASDVSLSANRPVLAQPEQPRLLRTFSPAHAPAPPPIVIVSPPVHIAALMDARDDTSRSEGASESSQPPRRKRFNPSSWKLLPEKLLHFDPSKDPRLLAL